MENIELRTFTEFHIKSKMAISALTLRRFIRERSEVILEYLIRYVFLDDNKLADDHLRILARGLTQMQGAKVTNSTIADWKIFYDAFYGDRYDGNKVAQHYFQTCIEYVATDPLFKKIKKRSIDHQQFIKTLPKFYKVISKKLGSETLDSEYIKEVIDKLFLGKSDNKTTEL